MIDPENITNFNRTEEELQEFALFSVIAAGKTASIQALKLHEFLTAPKNHVLPFRYIRCLMDFGVLRGALLQCKMGQYARIESAFEGLVLADDMYGLANMDIPKFDAIGGIGPKTARFFLLHSREGFECAVLDVHILKWLREIGYDAPQQTPQNVDRYRRLEKIFLKECRKREKTPAEWDLELWTRYSRKVKRAA